MPRSVPNTSKPVIAILSAALLATVLVAVAPASGGTTPRPHWGPYQWSGGAETANVRAFWVIDRTGDQRMQFFIDAVASGWNKSRETYPELPYIAVHHEGAGPCFVNDTPGYSVVSACMMPSDIHGTKGVVSLNPDDDGHLIGAAFAVSHGLADNEGFNVVCHLVGHVMGLETSADPNSCMSHNFPNQLQWYVEADADDILALYAHGEGGVPPASTTTLPAETTTTVSQTTTTTVPEASTTTTVPEETTTTTTTPIITLPPTSLPSTTLPGL